MNVDIDLIQISLWSTMNVDYRLDSDLIIVHHECLYRFDSDLIIVHHECLYRFDSDFFIVHHEC